MLLAPFADLVQADVGLSTNELYRETYRPQFHFTAQHGWHNDPNGLVYYQGEYHLFFQHNPFGTEWGNMTWGHAVSRDLVHWEQLPNALEPDKLGTMFSGSAVVDWENTAGFQTGSEKTLIAFYTAAGGTSPASEGQPFTQCLAYSTDRGRTWTKYSGNPVLQNLTAGNRDPKVFWHERTKRWVMALYVDAPDGDQKDDQGKPKLIPTIQFFNSPDTKHWTYLSRIDHFFECPDLFELPVDGDPQKARWVVFAADGNYLVGRFDGKEFAPESGKHTGDWGANYYAAQTYSDIPAADGRRIILGWMRGGQYPGMPFNQQMTFPCELTLRTFPEGIRLCKYPVREISTLYARTHQWEDRVVKPGDNPLAQVSGELFDLEAEVATGTARDFGFVVRGHKVNYSTADGTLSCLGRTAELSPSNGRLKLRLLVDRTSLEVFGNEGQVAMSSCFLPQPDNRSLEFYATGSAVRLVSLRVHELNSAWTLDLAARGKSSYRIVVPAKAIPSERYAAEELQRYLGQMSGATLPIGTDAEPVGSHEILLGDNAHLETLGIHIDFDALKTDGFVLRTHGNHLVIAGDKPRGTLYGVYALLEEKLGVRWFTPEVERVPKRERVAVTRLDETHVPALENRDVFWREMMQDADFAARHRLNGQHYGLAAKHGGPFTVYYPFVHSFDALVPRELCEEHPEYWPLINGERKRGYVQRCLSNPDVLRLSIERVRQWIQEHPEATIISVSQNDTFNYCQCDQCKALDEAEGSPAASLLKFVNAVAEAIAHDHPNVRIDTLAYQYTRKPPKTVRPRANVIVRLCSIECCFAHPLESCPSEKNRRFCDDIVAWEPVAPLLYVWDYTPNFAHYQQPFPNFDSLQANVRFFVKHGVKSLFEQGNYSAGGHGEMEPLRAYLLAKLLWDPDADVKQHTTEFLEAYYGQAAGKMREYLELLQGQVRGKDRHAHIFDPPKAAYLTDELIHGAERLFDEAEQVADNDDVRFRVQVARLPIWYVRLATDRVTGDDRAQLLERFLAIARKAGVSDISEGRTLDDWAKPMGAN